MIYVILYAIAVLLSLLRATGHKSQSFQAAAHLFVGGLLGAYFDGWNTGFLIIAVVLTVVEIVCFFALRKKGA